MKAEQTLGKLWQEFEHRDEGQTSGQMGPCTALQRGEAQHSG